jgi:beta-N-acetylglucosaminidase
MSSNFKDVLLLNNKIIKSFVSLMLIISIIFSSSSIFISFAESKSGYITNNLVKVRTSPTSVPNDNIIKIGDNNLLLNTNHKVTIIETVDSQNDENYPKWCHINFTYNGKQYTGYVAANFVTEKVQAQPGGIITGSVPEIYKEYINELAETHPNWNFVIYDTGLEWSSLFSKDAQGYIGRSLVEKSFPVSYRSTESGAYDWTTDKFISQDAGGWYQANQQTIAYYMDPRNFFNEESIFMFESLKYDNNIHTISGVQAILNGSFMSDKTITNTDGELVTYAQAYIDAGVASGVSPYHLASRTLQEVPMKGNTATNGNHSQYPGYYNFYSIHAYAGNNPIASGLKYASSTDEKYMLPWNTPYKAIVGGAKWIGSGYIDKDQDTLYYQKFNVVNQVWSHQYMGNIMAPYTEAKSIFKSYKNLDILNTPYVFVIPYYKNMPNKPCELPKSSNSSPNNWLSSLTVEGYKFEFNGNKTSGYSITVPESVSSVNISAKPISSKSTVKGTGKVDLNAGNNNIKVVVTAENGNEKIYYIEIIRSSTNVIPLTSISLDKTEISMFNGESNQLSVKYNPSNTTDNKSVKWSSSDTSIATVDNNGKVVAIGKGTAVITAKVGEFTSTCQVNVSNNIIVGDIDADGAVTISDALMIFKYKTNEIKLSDTALKAADTDKNGKVELADALRIFKYKSGEVEKL